MSHNCPTIARADPFSANPFSTRHVRPGSVDYVFGEGEDAGRIVARLQAAGWRGEIVGPHGSGKSALLAALIPEIRRVGKAPLLVELHDGQRRLPIDLTGLALNSVLIVDGYEQLGFGARFRLASFRRRYFRRRVFRQQGGIGLLVTAHRSVGFCELHRTRPTIELAIKIVERLAADVPREDIQRAFDRRDGNIREMLFDLYDLFEQRSRG